MKKQKVYVVMIDDVESGGAGVAVHDCTVWTTKKKAVNQLKLVTNGYKKEIINELIQNGDVSFDENNPQNKPYIMLETEDCFSFYEYGHYRDNHVEVRIMEKEIDEGGSL